jgi:exonuclease SbcC
MIIKSLYLENIRSYKSQEFYFKEGMTLLSGDIGSGKSTVLLSVEFALFGLIRGAISGAAILRHGTKEGLVKLKFSINNENYEIERGLKRTANGIVQEKCAFVQNAEKINLTPIELKSKILKVLGYPDDLVTKSKTLIFRYTVYTPQEEMKQIIFDAKDERLEKLRRIFGVDKYELVKNNANNYARELRAELKQYPNMKAELDELLDDLKNIKTKINILFEEQDSLKKQDREIEDAKKDINEKKELLTEEREKFTELKSKNNVTINEINNIKKTIKESADERDELEKDIKKREEKTEKIIEIKKTEKDVDKELQELHLKREEFEKKANDATAKNAIIKNKLEELNELLSSINELEICPTCLQEVTEEHKERVHKKEQEKLATLKEKQERIKEILEKINKTKQRFEDKKKELEKERDEIKTNMFKKKIIDENKKIIHEKKEQAQKIKDKIKKLEEEFTQKEKQEKQIREKLEEYKNLEEEIKKLKIEEEELNKKIITHEKRKSTLEQSKKEQEKTLKEKEEKKQKKEQTLKKLEEKRLLEQWLTNHFTNLASIIEKYTLTKIHREFNTLFREWFNMLIEDAELDANIEQDFSLSIAQNGYDTTTENLSGGEKTAIALSYRLALNKVINDLVHDVKTKGLMILDEPTDGFSSEQLDRVRDVLEKTRTKQIIIVSHEMKLESFVEHIIRINKNNHESEVLQI